MEPDIAQRFLDDAQQLIESGQFAEAAQVYLWFNDVLENPDPKKRGDIFGLEELVARGFTQKRLQTALAQIACDQPEQFVSLKSHLTRLPLNFLPDSLGR